MKRFMLIVECPEGTSYQDVRDVLKETVLQVGSAVYSRSGYPADGDGAHISTGNVRGYWVVDSL